MKIAVAADHAGFPLKDFVIRIVNSLGHEAIDLGTSSTEAVDYPDYARAVADELRAGKAERGILVCGSGVGACIAANKFHGIRAGTCHDHFSAHQCVEDDAANVLCIGARIIGQSVASEIVKSFLAAQFSNAERHRRRLDKVMAIEAEG